MAQEPSKVGVGFFFEMETGLSDPNNGSQLPAEANVTCNSTGPAPGRQFFLNHKNIVHLVCLLIALLGLVGNGTVIWLLGFRVKRNPFSVYILHLAIADFAFLLCLGVRLIIFISSYHLTKAMSKCFTALFLLSGLAGLNLLMAISTVRCLSVTFPIWYKCHRPAHLSTIVCALIWGLSVCLGIPWYLCVGGNFRNLCKIQFLVYCVLSLLTLLVLCVSSLTLLIRVRCCSRQRQVTKLYRVILLTVLAYLVLRLPLGLQFLFQKLKIRKDHLPYILPICRLLAALNSAVNPVIYFLVGRQGQRLGRRALGELLQSVLTEDTS